MIILDVEMGGMNGIETAKQIRKKDQAVSLFFSTKHSQYAYNSFSVNPSGYLVKTEADSQYILQLSNAIRCLGKRKQKFLVEYQGEKIWIEMADILFLKYFEHCVIFYMVDGSIYKTRKSLYRILEEAPESYLTLINRNVAINVMWIEFYLDGSVKLRTLNQIHTVARRRKKEVEDKYIRYCKESM